MTKKPYYKLVIGKTKPYTTADMRYPVGRVRIEVSDSLGVSGLIASIMAIRWGDALVNVHQFWTERGVDYEMALTEPGDRPLAAEVQAIIQERAERAAARAAT